MFQKKQIIFVFLVLIALCLLITPQAFTENNQKVYIIQINDASINPITAQYIEDSIEKAEQDNVQCLVIELDTPGGLLNSTRAIVKRIMASKVPIVVYIYPSGSRAGSAGVFITYASHIAVMAPSTNIGAAHPVQLGSSKKISWPKQFQKKNGEEPGEKSKESSTPMEDKILNDTVAFVKSIAEKRNRNVEWAEKSVRGSDSITETEALKKRVINLIANDEKDLLQKLDGQKIVIDSREIVLKTKEAQIEYIAMNSRQKLLNVLADPNIAYILMILGFYGLLYEITHPGIGVPGVLGTIFLILAFYSMQTLPTNYAGVALIALGIILFIAEAAVPGFGLLTLGGVTSMVLGSLILFNTAEPIMRVSWSLIIAFPVTTAVITLFLVRVVLKAHRQKVLGGGKGMIGETGYAKTSISLKKPGKVFVHGEIWDAFSEETIEKGDAIVVEGIRKLTLTVKKERSSL